MEKSKFTKNKAKKVTAAKQALHDENKRPKKKRRILQYSRQSKDDDGGVDMTQLREELKKKNKEIEKLQAQVENLLQEQKSQEKNFDILFSGLKRGQFSYGNLKEQPSKVFDLSGFSIEEFDCLYHCVQPFVHLICYPDCKTDGLLTNNRKLDLKTELMTFFTVSRHSLHLSVMAWMVQGSEATISRCFCGWAVFLSTLFDCLDLRPLPGFVQAFLPKVFEDAGFAETEVLGDATESWIAQSENFEVNNITFSNYKNHTTGKTPVWIYPHGGLLCCSDTYPGTISDKDITEQCGVLDNVNKGKVVLTDKGFAEVCLKKGVLHNRPPMKFSDQYNQSEISVNFDIATLRVYNENYIGRMRDWTILNSCWPMTRIDLLGHCFKVFAHVVNILKTPVGPKESS
ncbi:uncharacterized protein LOC110252056 [Exaiptasia diaphana]|uniref:DDE Tnp4 domain-containing protein n=1 Tax=Exaiptasia diaphana TaxID=2652724 RepID=A0A913YXY3_EXADI|nr:uncharacterized protein LOC110252056 [Exaiptasia diaphana]